MEHKQRSLNCKLTGVKFFSWSSAIVLFLLAGCETTQSPAPLAERTVTPGKAVGTAAEKPQDLYYVVQKGDTFYSIAHHHGIDQKVLAEWNNITDPASIVPGQRINISVPPQEVEPELFAVPQQSSMPVIGQDVTLPQDSADSFTDTVQDNEYVTSKIKTHPKALKLPYSEQNVTRLQYSVNPALNESTTEYATTPGQSTGTRIEHAALYTEHEAETLLEQSESDWIWPTAGTLLSSFSNNSKGLKIAGQSGQSVLATAGGEVVYSGDGLRGYGNLIIIKHNDALLSAYAHNSKLLVKEGDTVSQGQKIAEMGDSDTDAPQLHFEIRRYGKPVDPLKYLPAGSD